MPPTAPLSRADKGFCMTETATKAEGPPPAPMRSYEVAALRADESLYTLLGWAAFIYMTDRELGASFLEELRPLV